MQKSRMLPLMLLLAGCGARAGGNASALNWAHFAPDSANGGPLGRIEMMKQGFDVNFTKLKICVETGKKGVSDDQLLLESRLAYAAWLEAAGGYGEEDWQRFEFAGSAKCRDKDPESAGFIAIYDPTLAAADERDQPYQPQHISCQENGRQLSCQGNGITLGWGGPGGMMHYFFRGKEAQWTKLEAVRPSSTTLSPYVAWLPLTEDLARSDALDQAGRDAMIARYNGLLGRADASLAELSGFVKDLGAAKVTTAKDPVFDRLAQEFYASGTSALDRDYQGERGMFSTMLHEVGHQFGMDHAHDPGHESLTGASEGATQNADGQWVSKAANMAYGLPYLYLTDDDQLGIKDDAAAIRALLAAHK